MSTLTIKCLLCKREFKTYYSLKKHISQRHPGLEDITPVFEDAEGNAVPVPEKKELYGAEHKGYIIWLAGLTERVISILHPRLPGKWVKIDSQQVPVSYFQHFISKLNAKVNSVRDMPHRAQPAYRSSCHRFSYKIFSVDNLWDALEEQRLVTFIDETMFAGNEVCNESSDILTAEEEIERAKERASNTVQYRRRVSSKSSLIVGFGEGRATREIELIWWPHLYSVTSHGRLVIRLYVKKCEF